jgi:hypothetical protein
MSRSGTRLRDKRLPSGTRAVLGVGFSFALVLGCTTAADLTPVATIAFQTQDSVLVGRTVQLHPTVTDANGRITTDHRVSYDALTPSSATVDASGLVTGVAPGTGLFRVSAGGVSITHGVKVLDVVAQVVLSGPTTDLPVGQTRQLSATLTNGGGQAIAGRAIVWSSLNPSVAIVNSQGVVTGIAVGTAQIRAGSDYDQKYGTVTVNVTPGVISIASITFTPASDTLIPGDPKQYNPLVKDTQGNTVTSFVGRNVQWQTSNQPVASVSQQSGGAVVTANLPGTATITVTIDNVTSNNLVISVIQVATIQVSPSPVALTTTSRTQQLSVVLKDANGNTLTTTRPINYQSQNPTCVSVSPAGLVTALFPTGVTCPPSVVVNVSAGGTVQPVTVTLN